LAEPEEAPGRNQEQGPLRRLHRHLIRKREETDATDERARATTTLFSSEESSGDNAEDAQKARGESHYYGSNAEAEEQMVYTVKAHENDCMKLKVQIQLLKNTVNRKQNAKIPFRNFIKH